MKRIAFSLLFLLFIAFESIGQLSCSSAFDVATAVGIDAPGFNVNVVNAKHSGGTCGTINYQGQEINGTSGFDLKVDVGISADKVICGLVDGTLPNPLDLITIDPTFRCEFNIINIEGYIEAYAISAYPSASLEKSVKATVNRTDVIQVFAPSATTIELPLQVSASLVTMQTFCDPNPNNSVAEAKAEVSASLGGNSVTVSDVAKVSGGFLENKYPSVSQTISVSVPAGVSTMTMIIKGELSAKSKVRGLSPLGVVVCGSNAGASAGHINVGNFTATNGDPLPEGLQIVGLSTGINYSNPGSAIDCIQIPPPSILVTENDSCGLGQGIAIVSPNSDTLDYLWSNGVMDTITTNLTYGTHFLNVSDSAGCSRDFHFFVEDAEAPDINLFESYSIEENETVTLVPVDSGSSALTFIWSTGETTATITANSAGIYSTTITTAAGCEYEASTEVQVGTPIDFSPYLSANYLFTGNADDLSGNNNHGTVFGAILTTDRKGRPANAYYFDGVDDYIELPAVPATQPDSALTVTAWFKTDNLTGSTIIKNSGEGFELALNTQRAGRVSSNLHVQSGNNPELNSPFSTYADDQWHSLAITYNAKTGIYRLFVDCNLNGEYLGPIDSIAYQAGTPITIGKNGVNNNNFFKGAIDDIKIFSGVLNEEELAYLFQQQPDFSCHKELYFEDFEAQVKLPEWSDSTYFPIDSFNVFGRYSTTPVNFTLPDVPTGLLTTICFDFWAIDSWDGTTLSWGKDLFLVYTPDGRSILNASFSNTYDTPDQTYPSDYDPGNPAVNPYGTGADYINHESSWLLEDYRYRICRSFSNFEDTLRLSLVADINQSIADEAWGIDNFSVFVYPKVLNTADEIVTCNTDGSYSVSIPFTPTGESVSYMAVEQGNVFGDIDTVYFTDDGTVSTINMGPYTSGRDYSIVIVPVGFEIDCYPAISGTPNCIFNQPCNLGVNLSTTCINDSLIVTGVITGGMAPYSVYSNGYTTILYPGDGQTFTYSIFDCSTPINTMITDINMCQLQDSLILATEIPFESNCLSEVVLHPNPVSIKLHVLSSRGCGETHFKIYDSLGRIMQSGLLTGDRQSLDVRHLQAGVYFLYMDNKAGIAIRKFVII